jgi:hypothetical protein
MTKKIKKVAEDPALTGLPKVLTLEFYVQEDRIIARWIQKGEIEVRVLMSIADQFDALRQKLVEEVLSSTYDSAFKAGYKEGRGDGKLEKISSSHRAAQREN